MADERIKKSLNDGRESRGAEDHERLPPEDQMAFSEEQMQMFFDEWQQQAMPKLPDIPGWHVCWLSTTNIYDSVDKRIRMGYQAVKPEEVPGYEHMRVKSGEFAGLISINELVMFKIPMPSTVMNWRGFNPSLLTELCCDGNLRSKLLSRKR